MQQPEQQPEQPQQVVTATTTTSAPVATKPDFFVTRIELFEKLYAEAQAHVAELANKHTPIKVTFKNGDVVEGEAFGSNPFAICKKALESNVGDIKKETIATAVVAKVNGKEWDMSRPLESDCLLELFTFDDSEGKHTFWHSSAHLLGQAMEEKFSSLLNIGPATESNFFYDSLLPDGKQVSIDEARSCEALVNNYIKQKQQFQRLEVTPDQAMQMFKYSPFKVAIISKVPKDEKITLYRCGNLVDLCRGPHLPNAASVKAFKATAVSSSYADGTATGQVLQRVYGVSFPSKEKLKEYETFIAEAAKRDHRAIGKQQELFFFHPLSPGSAFWLPRGYRIYTKLISFLQDEYRQRGYLEVLTPNVFSSKLWETSGHWDHYKDNMFLFKSEDILMGLKPMNCPGHCLLFRNRVRSYRELPLRIAEFGVLHRNELSGALHGLTRVRRFQQDDAHIFCRVSQIKQEVEGVLDLVKKVYSIFDMPLIFELSTRPKDFLGEIEVWNKAELELQQVLDASGFKWKLNPGDGAFYGPKIDIHVQDALKRTHQCATVQLDFQMPKRFELSFVTEQPGTFEQPVMIHRAVLGSLERFIGVLTEHTAGKWPLWLSPRQIAIVPVSDQYNEYAHKVGQLLHAEGFHVDVDDGSNLMKKKIAEAQTDQYNLILVVGKDEAANGTVNVRTRENVVKGAVALNDFVVDIKKQVAEFK